MLNFISISFYFLLNFSFSSLISWSWIEFPPIFNGFLELVLLLVLFKPDSSLDVNLFCKFPPFEVVVVTGFLSGNGGAGGIALWGSGGASGMR